MPISQFVTRHSALWPRTAAAALLGFSAFASMAQTAAPSGAASTPRVDQRQANQERRIDQGVASGELTRRETRRLEHQQGAIQRAENRAKADGEVTAQERARLHHMQDHASGTIARQKHDRQHRPAAASGAATGAAAPK